MKNSTSVFLALCNVNALQHYVKKISFNYKNSLRIVWNNTSIYLLQIIPNYCMWKKNHAKKEKSKIILLIQVENGAILAPL